MEKKIHQLIKKEQYKKKNYAFDEFLKYSKKCHDNHFSKEVLNYFIAEICMDWFEENYMFREQNNFQIIFAGKNEIMFS